MAKAHWLVLPDLLAWQPFSGTEHNRPVDVGEQPLPVLPHDGVAFAIRAEAYAVQPSVSPPNPSGNPKLNPCKLWGFSEEMRIQYIWVSQFLPRLKPWASLRLDGDER